MTVYLGADHRGFALKEKIVSLLKDKGYNVEDMGANTLDPQDDYVDFAAAVAQEVAQTPESRGVVLCGSGVGIDIASNKIHGIRCGLGFSPEQIRAARADDDINLLALPSDFLDQTQAQVIIDTFLSTPFKGEERHKRRIEKIKKLEKYDE